MRELSRHASSTTSKAILYLLSAAAVLLFAGCASDVTLDPKVVGFELSVTPAQMNAVPGERCVLLVTLDPSLHGSSRAPVEISGSCPGAEVSVEHALLKPGEVAEVTVIPGAELPAGQDPNLDYFLAPTIRGARGGIAHTVHADLTVQPYFTDDIAVQAAIERERFIPWLAQAHPELGITAGTEWMGTMPAPVLVVAHYLYFSDEWEMHVEWHVMIAPYDWTRIELRRRFTETLPAIAFEISSRSAVPAQDPIAITPNGWLWR